MINLSFDNGTVEQFTLVLSTRDGTKLGQISNVQHLKYTNNLNAADELSFEVYKQLDDHEEVLWDEIYDLRLVWIPELEENFEIRVELTDQVYKTKTLTCTSLCECELSQAGLYNIEINTAEDIARPDYDVEFPTVFYRILPEKYIQVEPSGDENPAERGWYEKVGNNYVPTTDTQVQFGKAYYTINPEYTKRYTASLLHRILDKVPAYTIAHVDSSLMNLQRMFSISNTTVYDFLTGDCSEQFNCLFVFDSINRTVSAYDLYTVCQNPECGHRGDFRDVCPKCSGTNLKYFGEDTTIFVSTENLTDEVQFETDVDSIKNAFRLETGDDNMTAAVVNSNPTGSRYIYEFSDEARRDMPEELVSKMDDYDDLYAYYNNEYEMSLDDSTRNAFNEIAAKYSLMTCQVCGYRGNYTHSCPECNSLRIVQNTWEEIPETIVGYQNLIPFYYECIDLYSYLKSSMMPQVIIEGTTANAEVYKLNTELSDPDFVLGMSRVSSSTTLATANIAMTNWVKTVVKTGYVKVTVDTDSANSFNYIGETDGVNWATWYGRFKVTNYSDDTDYEFTNFFTINVNDKFDVYIEEKIVKQLLSKCEDDAYDVLNKIAKKEDDPSDPTSFKNVIRLYSSSRLQSFHDAIEAVLGILIDAGQGIDTLEKVANPTGNPHDNGWYEKSGDNYILTTDTTVVSGKDYYKRTVQLYDSFYAPYYQMLQECEDELNLRNHEIEVVWGSYDMQGLMISDGMIQYIATEVNRIHKALNFQDYVGEELYKIYTTYIREQTYTNSNYISDGLDNNQLFDNARQFLARAKEELHKSATYQHSIKSNLNNLLAIDEFRPLVDKFTLGNWIRVQCDETVYRLRLIFYSIDFDSIQKINTEFSDVTITANGLNDIQSIIKQAASMSSSYGYVEKQAEQGSQVKIGYIDDWVENGLNSALVRINNNNDEDIRIDEAGITARTYDDVSEEYDDEQMRITHNVIAFTDDNWKSVKTALGKFEMTHHNIVDDNYGGLNKDANAIDRYTDYGLVANAVLAGWIVGSHMESSTIIGSHFQAPGNNSYIDMTSETTVGSGREYFIRCSINESGSNVDKFIVKKDGTVKAVKITANSGKIGNWTILPITSNSYIGAGALYYYENGKILGYNSDTAVLSPKGCYMDPGIGQKRFGWTSQADSSKPSGRTDETFILGIGNNFGVNLDGKVYASDIEASGKLITKWGSLGTWKVDKESSVSSDYECGSGALYHGDPTLNTYNNNRTLYILSPNGTKRNYTFWWYDYGAGAWQSVTKSWLIKIGNSFGIDSDKQAYFNGKIYAEGGEIAGYKIMSNVGFERNDGSIFCQYSKNKMHIGGLWDDPAPGYWTFFGVANKGEFAHLDYGGSSSGGIWITKNGKDDLYDFDGSMNHIYADGFYISQDIINKNDTSTFWTNFDAGNGNAFVNLSGYAAARIDVWSKGTSMGYRYSYVGASSISDRRKKENIHEITSKQSKAFFNKLTPSYFNFKDNQTKVVRYGVIAQNLEEALDCAKLEHGAIIQEDEDGMKSVVYTELIGISLAGVKHLYEKMDEQQTEIDLLKEEINRLKGEN